METEESLRSSVNHDWKRRRKNPYVLVWTMTENGDGRILTFYIVWTMKTETEAQADARRKRRRKEKIVPFSSFASSASVELTLQTSKREPVLT